MVASNGMEMARIWRSSFIAGAEVMSVAYRHRAFPQHSHDGYVIGVVTEGAERLDVGGTSYIAGAGSVLQIHPGEVHANAAIGSSILKYDVLYLPEPALRPYLLTGREGSALSFMRPVSDDPSLFEIVRNAHVCLAADAGRLEQESAILALLLALTRSSAPIVRRLPEPTVPIGLAREFIDTHFASTFGLQTLSRLTGLSVYHLVRSFKKSVGLSPLAYRNQRRITSAKAMLLQGVPIAEVALSVGYSDQSHFTRHFQKLVGLSPGRYAQQ
ncbi:helix-turn-helix domain-containing protein [Blastomonas sp. SL216]|uniref:helix-turn-helix domain-containing protein n=1 Tax=Blastomonas sp. SL216 TaxID=2995169 RepID=UPI0023776EF6|nr:AraC family transcriptional regulator [Blastomonas sp. SL216]